MTAGGRERNDMVGGRQKVAGGRSCMLKKGGSGEESFFRPWENVVDGEVEF